MGFEQLTRPYRDPDYLWKKNVITLALDIETAKRDWRSLRPSLLQFFTADDERIDHGAVPGLDRCRRRREPRRGPCRRAAGVSGAGLRTAVAGDGGPRSHPQQVRSLSAGSGREA